MPFQLITLAEPTLLPIVHVIFWIGTVIAPGSFSHLFYHQIARSPGEIDVKRSILLLIILIICGLGIVQGKIFEQQMVLTESLCEVHAVEK